MVFLSRERQAALERTEFLLSRGASARGLPHAERDEEDEAGAPPDDLRLRLLQAGLPPRPALLFLSSLACAVLAACIFARIIAPYILPLFVAAGAWLPWSYVESRRRKRAAEFAADYPTVLLATASSIRVGLTPYLALERSVRLLARESLVRREVERLLDALRRGVPKEQAVAAFGATVAQPDLPLFRSAFLLALEHGGRFSPTLLRLASVSKDRGVLIKSALVSTATMRMTANILLALAPAILIMTSLRAKDYWTTFFHHPVANAVASCGILIIGFSYILLRRMSAFKP